MRKTVDVEIFDEGRDKGKVFHIKEKSAYEAEEWAIRALLALSRANAEMADVDTGMGMAAFAGNAFKALMNMDFYEAKPLLDEMMTCVKIRPDPMNPQITRDLMPDDIEEVATLIKLRREIFNLHTGFFRPEGISTSTSDQQPKV